MSLTAEDYRSQLFALLPPGRALTHEHDTELGALFLALGEELARVDGQVARILEEADPRVALELLGDWERVTGFPDACSDLAPTLEARRAAVVQRLTSEGRLTAAFIAAQCAALGFDVQVVEYEPSQCGFSVCGDELAGVSAWFHFDVLTDDVEIFEPECGGTVCGDPLGSIDNERLECLIARLKPVHTTFNLVLGS